MNSIKYHSLSDISSKLPVIVFDNSSFFYWFKSKDTQYDEYVDTLYRIYVKNFTDTYKYVRGSVSSSLYIDSKDHKISYNPDGIGLINNCGAYKMFLEGFRIIELECLESELELNEEQKNKLINENKSFHQYRIKIDISNSSYGYQPAQIYIFPKSYDAQKRIEQNKTRLRLFNKTEAKYFDEKYSEIIKNYNKLSMPIFYTHTQDKNASLKLSSESTLKEFFGFIESKKSSNNCYSFFDNMNKTDKTLFGLLDTSDTERCFLQCAVGISDGYGLLLKDMSSDKQFNLYVLYSNKYTEEMLNFYINSDLYKRDEKIRGMQYKKFGNTYIFIYSDDAKEKVSEMLNNIQLVE